MSELNLSLYHLAEGSDLLELFEIRAEMESELRAVEASDPDVAEVGHQNIRVIDEQIAAYMAALPTKVDSVRHVWKRIEVLIAEAAEEVKFQSKRGQHLKADLERLKDYCQRCMELIEWKPGKPRKLQGRSGYLLLKGNGGRPAVEVYDETLVPADLCVAEGRVPLWIWQSVLRYMHLAGERGDGAAAEIARDLDGCSSMKSVPSVSLIAARLSEACVECEGAGDKCCNPDHTRPTDCGEACRTCRYCNGSGKASVPGARLKPVGSHVEVR